VPKFVQACAEAMAEDAATRITQADAFLAHTSWDKTWSRIALLLDHLTPATHAEDVKQAVEGSVTAP
jgi:hypothetical protein